jgi:hypothetical protein
MLTSLRPHRAALKSGTEYSKLQDYRISGLQEMAIATVIRNRNLRHQLEETDSLQSPNQFFDPAILPFCNSSTLAPFNDL